MAIADGMRTHDEGLQPRYRMPDLLTKEEMVLFFASTYGVKVVFEELDDELREMTKGVATLPIAPIPTDRDAETVALRKQLGLSELEEKLDVRSDRTRELESRTMTVEDFADKYGEQPKPDPQGAYENAQKAQEAKERGEEEPPDVDKGLDDEPNKSAESPQESPKKNEPSERLDTLLKDEKTLTTKQQPKK